MLRGGVGGSQLGCHRPWQVRWIELQPSASVPVPSIPGSRAFGMRPLAPEALAPSARPLASGPWGLAVKVRPPGQGPQGVGPWRPAHDVRGIWPTVSSSWHRPSVPCLGLPPRFCPSLFHPWGAEPLARGPWPPGLGTQRSPLGVWTSGLAVKVRPPARALKALGFGTQPTTSAASGPRCPAHGTNPQCPAWGSRHARLASPLDARRGRALGSGPSTPRPWCPGLGTTLSSLWSR